MAPPPEDGASMPGDRPHRRWNALTGEWVLVSPQRLQRPWRGEEGPPPREVVAARDPGCYLCPGAERAGGVRNPDYEGVWVFENDFPALTGEEGDGGGRPGPERERDPLFRHRPARGTCRVLCYGPRHDRHLADLPPPRLREVVDAWAGQVAELGRRHRWVQVFENRGEQMGASNPHPHGQVWALDDLPTIPAREDERQRAYHAEQGEPLLAALARRERERGERVVLEAGGWLALVPWWAVWPFELLLLPARPVPRLPDLGEEAREGLAEMLGRLLPGLDRLFGIPFPYSMGWHGAPRDGADPSPWVVHGHLLPPLLRSAGVRKHMVGFELLAEPQRDLTPEAAAARLRELFED